MVSQLESPVRAMEPEETATPPVKVEVASPCTSMVPVVVAEPTRRKSSMKVEEALEMRPPPKVEAFEVELALIKPERICPGTSWVSSQSWPFSVAPTHSAPLVITCEPNGIFVEVRMAAVEEPTTVRKFLMLGSDDPAASV